MNLWKTPLKDWYGLIESLLRKFVQKSECVPALCVGQTNILTVFVNCDTKGC